MQSKKLVQKTLKYLHHWKCDWKGSVQICCQILNITSSGEISQNLTTLSTFLKRDIHGPFFSIIVFSILISEYVLYKILPMTGIELQTSGIRSKCSANWGSTTRQLIFVLFTAKNGQFVGIKSVLFCKMNCRSFTHFCCTSAHMTWTFLIVSINGWCKYTWTKHLLLNSATRCWNKRGPVFTKVARKVSATTVYP